MMKTTDVAVEEQRIVAFVDTDGDLWVRDPHDDIVVFVGKNISTVYDINDWMHTIRTATKTFVSCETISVTFH